VNRASVVIAQHENDDAFSRQCRCRFIVVCVIVPTYIKQQAAGTLRWYKQVAQRAAVGRLSGMAVKAVVNAEQQPVMPAGR